MEVNPGNLNKKIKIIQVISSEDSDGFNIKSENVIRISWAQVSQYSAKEKFMAGKEMSDVKMRFLIRYTNTTIDEDMLVEYAGKKYEIKLINNYGESDEYLEIIGEKKG